ncbi:MAG TPA: iron ABC transporter permease [Rhizomicrobium sp.]|jgi:iron complex transport system permease protein|nr:iron ABC transporter permease [Rhizomicrobium sp.]
MSRLIAVLLALLVMAFAVSLLAGRVWLPLSALHEVLSDRRSLSALIVEDIRLPRTLLALTMGAVLGLSGAVLQGFTRNPLAEPALLGVATGAALGAVIAIYFGLAAVSPLTGPLLGMLGGLAACAMTFALGRGGTVTLVLAGAAVSSLTAAGIALALNFAPNPYAAYEIMNWLLGSLADKSWPQVWLVLPFAAIGSVLLGTTGRALDALSLGEAQAQSLGVDLRRLNFKVVFGTALAVGAVTSVTGAIGFIGLVAPHLMRPLLGYQPNRILLPSALAGALLLLAADIAARLIHTGPELKLGVFTSLLGTPFFFWLVMRLRRTAP